MRKYAHVFPNPHSNIYPTYYFHYTNITPSPYHHPDESNTYTNNTKFNPESGTGIKLRTASCRWWRPTGSSRMTQGRESFLDRIGPNLAQLGLQIGPGHAHEYAGPEAMALVGALSQNGMCSMYVSLALCNTFNFLCMVEHISVSIYVYVFYN